MAIVYRIFTATEAGIPLLQGQSQTFHFSITPGPYDLDPPLGTNTFNFDPIAFNPSNGFCTGFCHATLTDPAGGVLLNGDQGSTNGSFLITPTNSIQGGGILTAVITNNYVCPAGTTITWAPVVTFYPSCNLNALMQITAASTGDNVPYLGSATVGVTGGTPPYFCAWTIASLTGHAVITSPANVGNMTAIQFQDYTGSLFTPTTTRLTCVVRDSRVPFCTVTATGTYMPSYLPPGTPPTPPSFPPGAGPISGGGNGSPPGDPGNPGGGDGGGTSGGGAGGGGSNPPGDPGNPGATGPPGTTIVDGGQPLPGVPGPGSGGTTTYTPLPNPTTSLCPTPLLKRMPLI